MANGRETPRLRLGMTQCHLRAERAGPCKTLDDQTFVC